ERERIEAVRPKAERQVIEKLTDMLDEGRPKKRRKVRNPAFDNEIVRKAFEMFGQKLDDHYPEQGVEVEEEAEDVDKRARRRRKLMKDLAAGRLDERPVEVEIEEPSNPFVQVFTPQGMEEMGLDNNASSPFPPRRTTRKVTVSEAKQILFEEEARKMIDQAGIKREAVVRTEQTGIIFLDELDKVASKSGGSGPDVSREGVQRDLLPIIEGSTVATKYGAVRTDHILFVAAGAFHMSKPSDLIPELQGRLPIRVELETLTEDDFKRILREPKNALTKQYQKLLAVDGVTVVFTDAAVDEIARVAAEVNAKTENIGARRLHTVMEKLLDSVLFDAPDIAEKELTFDRDEVSRRLSGLASDVDLSRYIL
ncbi:MAG TPA: ATP-dependent protease ATPase subunit HslU, partial [Fimbriimonadaceae bacterium]|nr:ATP-dependent protease ATPase subunit HslU [Fimbriimonadaceae bacterium]